MPCRLLLSLGLLSASASTAAACDASALIANHEGTRSCSYTDTTGHRTVGVGFNLDACSASKWSGILPSVDYQDVYSGKTCLTSDQIHTLLEYSMRGAVAESRRVVSNYDAMCCGVQNVVTDMTFNLGSLSGFGTLVSLFEKGSYAAAADDMKNTLWCRQVGRRCTEDADMVRKGCGGGGPSPSPPGPGPTSGCKTCIVNGGGKACADSCGACGSSCTDCVKYGGGKACASKCCGSVSDGKTGFTSMLKLLVQEAKDQQSVAGLIVRQPQCCFCSNGGDGSGACATVEYCSGRAKDGYSCHANPDEGCTWVKKSALEPHGACM
jgi:lysozyme